MRTRGSSRHGTIINRTDLVPYRDMIVAVQTNVQQLIAQGKSHRSAGRKSDRALRCQVAGDFCPPESAPGRPLRHRIYQELRPEK